MRSTLPPVILCKVRFPSLVHLDLFLSCSSLFNFSFRWQILEFKMRNTSFKKVGLEQSSIILNLDLVNKTSLSFITLMPVYSGAASRILGIIHPGNEKTNTLFQMQTSNPPGVFFIWLKFAKFQAPCHMGEVLLFVFKLTNWVEGLALLFKSIISQMAKTWSSSCANFSLYSRSFCVPEKWYVMGPRSIWRKRPELCFNYNCSQKNEFILSHLSSEDSGSNNRFKLTGRHNAFEILA